MSFELIGVFIAGLVIGGLIIWLFLLTKIRMAEYTSGEQKKIAGLLEDEKASKASLTTTVQNQTVQIEQLKALSEHAQSEVRELSEKLANKIEKCSAAETLNRRIPELEQELSTKNRELKEAQSEKEELKSKFAEVNTLLSEERKSAAEKLSLIDDAQKKLEDAFKALSSEALKSNNKSFLEIAETQFQKLQLGSKHDLDLRQKSIDELVKPLKDGLENVDKKVQELDKARVESYAKLDEQLKSLVTVQTNLQAETQNLVKALRAPAVRGRWGEIQLKRVVELAGMLEHCDFYQQPSVETEGGRLRPDMTVRLPADKIVVVDSKVPLEAYLNALQANDDASRIAYLKDHARQIRSHLQKLSEKGYWEQFNQSPEFVILFLPGETFFSAALEQDPELIEVGVSKKVIIATPTTLIALLKAVSYGWTQERLSKNAEQISDLGRDLYDRICKFAGYMVDLRKGIDKTVESYNKAIGSLESRILVSARKFKQLSADNGQEITTLEPVETIPRQIQSGELIVGEETIVDIS